MCIFFVIDKKQSFQTKELVKIIKAIDFIRDGPEYRYLKKHMMIALKQHGDGLQHLNNMTIVHINDLLSKMEEQGSGAFDPKNMIKTTFGKLMMTLTYGFDGEEGLKRIAEVEENRNFDLFTETGPCMILNFCPPLRFFVPFVRNTYNELLEQLNTYKSIFTDLTEKRRKDFDGKNPQVFIDHFLQLLGKPAKVGPGSIKIFRILSLHAVGVSC